jgi:hypothetical protein
MFRGAPHFGEYTRLSYSMQIHPTVPFHAPPHGDFGG